DHGTNSILLDKEYIAAWGHGNAIVTYSQIYGYQGHYLKSLIFDSVTHDGGKTWSTPTEISGSSPFCVGSSGGHACDQSGIAVPTLGADGSVYVAFESAYNLNPANLAYNASVYLVVKVDSTTGQLIAGPFAVARLVDGAYAYPLNAVGTATYQD